MPLCDNCAKIIPETCPDCGQPVAGVVGPMTTALREINHYAAVYSQDGLVQVQIKPELGGWVDVQS